MCRQLTAVSSATTEPDTLRNTLSSVGIGTRKVCRLAFDWKLMYFIVGWEIITHANDFAFNIMPYEFE